MIFFSTSFIFTQQITDENPNEANSSSSQKIKDDFKKLGKDLKDGMTTVSENVGSWIKTKTEQVQETNTDKPGSQTKMGIVLSVNIKNNTITIITTEGKTTTFGVTDSTKIFVQDSVTGLQTPFSGGKPIKLKNIKTRDWIHYSYNFSDAIKSILPDSNADTIIAVTIDVLR